MWSFSQPRGCFSQQLRLPFDLADKYHNNCRLIGTDRCHTCGSWDTGIPVSEQDDCISVSIVCNYCHDQREAIKFPTGILLEPSHLGPSYDQI